MNQGETSIEFVNSAQSVSFFIDKVGSQTKPATVVREVIMNAVEANATKIEIDWDPMYEKKGVKKLRISDNGDGMSAGFWISKLNLFASGKEQGNEKNYGIGVKMAGFYHHPHGVVYVSHHNGEVFTGKIYRDEAGTAKIQRQPNGSSTCTPLPKNIDFSTPAHLETREQFPQGTSVTLLGKDHEEDTFYESVKSDITRRFFRMPKLPNSDKRVWITVKHAMTAHGRTPYESKRTCVGMDKHLEDYSSSRGSVRIENATVHWFILVEDIHTRVGRNVFALAHKDELYGLKMYRDAQAAMRQFGIGVAGNRVALVIEIDPSFCMPNFSRSALERQGGESLPMADWQRQFSDNMPTEIQELMAAALEGCPEIDKQQLRENAHDMLAMSRGQWKKSKDGEDHAVGVVTGADGPISDVWGDGRHRRKGGGSGGGGGSSGTDYGLNPKRKMPNPYAEGVKAKRLDDQADVPSVKFDETGEQTGYAAAIFIERENLVVVYSQFKAIRTVQGMLQDEGTNGDLDEKLLHSIVRNCFANIVVSAVLYSRNPRQFGVTEESERQEAVSASSLSRAISMGAGEAMKAARQQLKKITRKVTI